MKFATIATIAASAVAFASLASAQNAIDSPTTTVIPYPIAPGDVGATDTDIDALSHSHGHHHGHHHHPNTTHAPTDPPSDIPTDVPTESPTDAPTETPTDAPTTTPNATHPLSYQDYHAIAETAAQTITNQDHVAQPLILSGTVVPANTKTWVVGLRSTPSGSDFCGGTLITPKHVLTAAHCLAGGIKYVSVGTHYVSGAADGERIVVTKQTRHPKNDANTNAYDFLVLELATASKFQPTKLVSTPPTVGQSLTVLGWGTTSSGGAQSNVLLQVDVPVVGQTTCAKTLTIDSTMLCAGGLKNKDSCQGDSGGPLTNAANGLIGVVSWGNGCGLAGYPGVYGRVSVVKDWIQSVTGKNATWV